MDRHFSIAQAKDRLSALVQAAERGEVVTVTRRGKPVARVVSESEYRKLISLRRKTGWSKPVLDTSNFRFDRDEANRR
jgi:prevent-host-death family protein